MFSSINDSRTHISLDLTKVDGMWGQWTDWSVCNAACNSGIKRRSRFCNSPFPAHGGSDCVGDGYEEKQCHADACPSMFFNRFPLPSFY